jgi:hypothetical protein
VFECPNCHSQTRKLIGSSERNMVGCPQCLELHIANPIDLHQVVCTDNSGKHKVTRGKMDEIDHRVIAEDGIHVYDRRNGQPAQF